MTGPYAQAAGDYWNAGWRGILPIPSRHKGPPPDGYTGNTGIDPSFPDVMAWAEDHADGNVALRLPEGVLGLDIDNYDTKPGAASLEAAERAWGALPATWRTTSRDDGVSGIRLYRVPRHADGGPLRWPGGFGPGTETIRRGHRYAVAPPSIHPEGRTYRWITPQGHVSLTPPRATELPWLPAAWVVGLTENRPAHSYQGAGMTDDDVKAWLEEHWSGVPCTPMSDVADELLDELHAGAHESLRLLMRLVGMAAVGHPGLREVLGAVREKFIATVAPRRDGGEATAAQEWTRSLFGAVDKVVGEMAKTGTTTSRIDPCDALVSPAEPTPPPMLELGVGDGVAELEDTPEADDQVEAALNAEQQRALAVEKAYQELAIRDEARRRLEAQNAPVLEMLGFADFLASPEPEPVVEDMFYVDSLSRVYGAPGCGKSFLALDVAFHVALGMDWGGKPVKQGPVVYVMAEGQRVNTHRAKAWLERHHVDPAELEGKFWAVPDKVVLTEAAAAPFVAAVTDLQPSLIFLDTQNAMQVGEENSASDTRVMRDALNAMRHATQACVVLIGHTGKGNQDAARGSNAAEGAMDTEIKVDNDGGKPAHVTVTVSRDKAAEDGAQWDFFLRMQPIPDHDKPGAVLVPMGEDVELPERKREDDLAWQTQDGVPVPTELLDFEGPGRSAMPDLARYMASEASERANDPHGIGRTRAEATNALKLAGHSKGTVWRAWSALIELGFMDTAEGVKMPHGRHVWSR